MADYSIVNADDAEDAYTDSDVPGEFRSLTEALGAKQGNLSPERERQRREGR